MQTSSLAYADTEPVRVFARKRHISPTKVYEWIDQGLIESFLEGNRRHVVLSSYDRLVRQRIAEQQGGTVKRPSSNPKVKARQAAAATPQTAIAARSTGQQRRGPAARPKARSTGGRGRS